MNGIHEVTGSIPVWSTILRSPFRRASARQASERLTGEGCHVGRTSDTRSRLAHHNAGRCPHTARYRPWQLHVAIELPDERRAIEFERYLKSGSGRAFAKRHFG